MARIGRAWMLYDQVLDIGGEIVAGQCDKLQVDMLRCARTEDSRIAHGVDYYPLARESGSNGEQRSDADLTGERWDRRAQFGRSSLHRNWRLDGRKIKWTTRYWRS